jgi:hypothetical protein
MVDSSPIRDFPKYGRPLVCLNGIYGKAVAWSLSYGLIEWLDVSGKYHLGWDSGIKAVEPAIRALLCENPQMPATVRAERVGWSGSPAWFREKVARIPPEYAPADPADRISYEPGDQAQCDLWFPEVRILVGAGNPRMLPSLRN